MTASVSEAGGFPRVRKELRQGDDRDFTDLRQQERDFRPRQEAQPARE